MNKAFEKILERLEERTNFLSDCTKYGNKDVKHQEKSYSTMMLYEVADLVDDLKEIVQEVAEEYNGGWIPCSEMLPESHNITDDYECPEYNVTIKGAKESTTLKYSSDKTWFDENGNCYEVIAWQPLLEPYKDNKNE